MPLYRVQLKQGSRTIVNHIEAKSVTSAIDFFQTLTTMQVSEVLEVKYQNNSIPPIDDMQYYKLYKGLIKNNNRQSKQIILQNLKLTKNENDIFNAAKNHLEINGLNIESVVTSLFKHT